MNYKVYDNCIKIFDSYEISKKGFGLALAQIERENPDLPIWANRSVWSMRREWATHNLLYALGMYRSRTKDVDLNFSHKWYVNLAYAVVGSLALLIIK